MDVRIKDLKVDMGLGTNGVEFEVRDTNGNHLGDFCVGKATIEWCKGRTHRGGGKQVNWDELITWFESHKS